MPMTRRDFVSLSLALTAGTFLAPRRAIARPRRLDSTYFDWKPLVGGVWVGMGEGGNSLLVVGQAEAILIDSKNAGFGPTLKREADSLGAPVRTLINTHHHGDHTGGNHAFIKAAKVIAHANAIPRIPANLDRYRGTAANAVRQLSGSSRPEAAQALKEAEAVVAEFPDAKAFTPTDPSTSLAGSPAKTTIAGAEVEFHHFGPGHTDNDLAVFFPTLNTIHCGDLLFNRMWPFIDPNGGGNTGAWIKCLEGILPLVNEKTVVIPGHGEVGDRTAITRQIEFFKDMRERAAKAIAAGTTREEFLKLDPGEYKDYEGRIRPITLGGLYDEAKAAGAK